MGFHWRTTLYGFFRSPLGLWIDESKKNVGIGMYDDAFAIDCTIDV